MGEVWGGWAKNWPSNLIDKPKSVNQWNCPMTLKNGSRSVIVELVQGLMGMLLWVKFKQPGWKLFRVILMTSQSWGINEIALWPWKIGPRSVIVELVRGLMRMHLWVKFEEAELKTGRVISMTNIRTDGMTEKVKPICSPFGGHN